MTVFHVARALSRQDAALPFFAAFLDVSCHRRSLAVRVLLSVFAGWSRRRTWSTQRRSPFRTRAAAKTTTSWMTSTCVCSRQKNRLFSSAPEYVQTGGTVPYACVPFLGCKLPCRVLEARWICACVCVARRTRRCCLRVPTCRMVARSCSCRATKVCREQAATDWLLVAAFSAPCFSFLLQPGSVQ